MRNIEDAYSPFEGHLGDESGLDMRDLQEVIPNSHLDKTIGRVRDQRRMRFERSEVEWSKSSKEYVRDVGRSARP
jgi:hypothetical protein